MPFPNAPLAILLVALAAYLDWKTGEIPNWVTLPTIAIGVLGQLLLGGPGVALSALLGVIAVGIIPFFFFRAGAMGGGDVKLYAAIGALAGPLLGTEILLLSTALAGLQAVVMIARMGRLREATRTTFQLLVNSVRRPSQRVPIPVESRIPMRLGPAIAFGTLIIMVRV